MYSHENQIKEIEKVNNLSAIVERVAVVVTYTSEILEETLDVVEIKSLQFAKLLESKIFVNVTPLTPSRVNVNVETAILSTIT